MGIGPIPRSAIRKFIESIDLQGDAADRFFDILCHVDDGYLGLIAADRAKSTTMPNAVGMDDPKGVRDLLRGIGARKKAVQAAGKKK